MTDLSPAAQAVVDAYERSLTCMDLLQCERNAVAAVLRAVADQFFFDWNGMCCADHLKYIAIELEAQ